LDYDAPVFFDVESMVVTLTRFDEVVHVLKDVLKICPEFLAFDYETTGLKPYNKGHKIASVSFCYEDDRAFSFPLQHPHWSSDQQKELIDLWSKVLQSDSKKIAHNLKYENVWSRVIVGVEPKNWESCTMNATHILDNRQRFSGLKFQALVRWGIEDYDKEIAPFLRDTDKRGLNKVLEAPLPKLLTYNAIDSLLTFWLFNEQHSEMSETEKFLDCNSFFTDSLLTLSDIEITGIPADLDYYHEVDRKLGSDLNHLEKELTEGKEARMFKEDTGKKINLKSDKDLRHLFFKLEKLPIIKETATKLPSVDIEVLLQLNSNLARNLIKYNKVDTIKNRYIAQFLREINDDGKLHPFFNLHRARTYRSASSNPNFQNIPVRDEQASSLTRNGIFPSKGRKILDWDYGALEVRIIACATLDPTLLHYCNDPSTDMHRDQAADLFALKPKEVPKKVRFYSKNCFVFPEFYGSYWRSCAPELWKNCKALEIEKGFSVEEHLAEMKIIRTKKNALDEFAKHVREVESIFWKKYEGVRDWQNETMKFYERFGYIELLTGFRCQGYMTRNELFNFPIQGPAFHCLMYSLNWINYELREKEFGTQIIGQIHDCCLFDTAPKEEKAVREMSTRIATQQIREDWKWIVVPLVLEFESTKVNGAWFSKSEEDKD